MTVRQFIASLKRHLAPTTFARVARMAKRGKMGFGDRPSNVWDADGRG